MADISSVTLPSGSSYNFKDSTARTTASNAPVKSTYTVVESKSADNVSISANGTAGASFTITKNGYTAIGIVGWQLENASSSGARYTFCRLYSTYISSQSTAYVHLRNRYTAGGAKVKVTIQVLYKKN